LRYRNRQNDQRIGDPAPPRRTLPPTLEPVVAAAVASAAPVPRADKRALSSKRQHLRRHRQVPRSTLEAVTSSRTPVRHVRRHWEIFWAGFRQSGRCWPCPSVASPGPKTTSLAIPTNQSPRTSSRSLSCGTLLLATIRIFVSVRPPPVFQNLCSAFARPDDHFPGIPLVSKGGCSRRSTEQRLTSDSANQKSRRLYPFKTRSNGNTYKSRRQNEREPFRRSGST
jgi:hypothetical protein